MHKAILTLTIVLALTGCDTADNYYITYEGDEYVTEEGDVYEGDTYEGDETSNYYSDDDSGSETTEEVADETDDETEDTGDEDTEEVDEEPVVDPTEDEEVAPETDTEEPAAAATLKVFLGPLPSGSDPTEVVVRGGEMHPISLLFMSFDSNPMHVNEVTVHLQGDTDGTLPIGDDLAINDNVMSCWLEDEDGTDISGEEWSPNGTYTFEIDVPLLHLESYFAEVVCRLLISSETSNKALYAYLDDSSVVATDVNDTDVKVDVLATNQDQSNWVKVMPGGDLRIVDHPNMPADGELVPDSVNNGGEFRFLATDEDMVVKTLSFHVPLSGFGAEYVEIDYLHTDGTRHQKATVVSNYEARFTGLRIAVAEDTSSDIRVNVYSAPYNCFYAMCAGDFVQVNLNANSMWFEAIGQTSGTRLDETDIATYIEGPTLTAPSEPVAEEPEVFGAADFWDLPVLEAPGLVVTLSANSPSGTGFVPGDQEVMRWNVTVTGSAADDYRLEMIAFDVNSTNNASSDWQDSLFDRGITVYNLSTDGTTMPALEGSCSHDCNDQIIVEGSDVVPHGTAYTYAAYMDSIGASAAYDDSIKLTIPQGGIAVFNYDTGETFRVEIDDLPLSGNAMEF